MPWILWQNLDNQSIQELIDATVHFRKDPEDRKIEEQTVALEKYAEEHPEVEDFLNSF
jgi:hypothetical protein